MKKIINSIWKFMNSRFFAISVIVILIIIMAVQCKRIINQDQEIDKNKQNISALHDSLKFERTKNGELLVSIDGYIATEKELKNINKRLWEEVIAQKGKVISLTNVVIQLKQDSTQLSKTIDELKTIIGQMQKINDSTYVAPWVLAYTYDSLNFDIFNGKTQIGVISKDPLVLRHKNTYLTKRETQIQLIWGQKIEKGKLRIFVQSGYPGFTIKSMEGVLIDPNTNPLIKDLMKKRHWFTGFGIGPNISTVWNIVESKPSVIFGIGLHYNIYEF